MLKKNKTPWEINDHLKISTHCELNKGNKDIWYVLF